MKNEETNGGGNVTDKWDRADFDETWRNGVVRGAWVVGLVCLLLLGTAGAVSWSLYNRQEKEQLAMMEGERNSFSDQLMTRDSTINEWLETFTQIENDLNLIKQKENIITVSSASGVEFTRERKDQILQDIKSINNLLDENRKKLASLNAQLRNSGREIKGLNEMIASLETRITEREGEIAALKTTVSEKDSEIGNLNLLASDLQTTVTEQSETISIQTSELNKAYLASGTFKDLKEMGIVSKEGGFLGLGRTESIMEDFTDSLFSQIDITEMKMIPVNSKGAKLITEHPAGSYELIRETDDKIAYIEIKDPEQFWKISKYAVVEVIK
ncbi:hypothetical protein EG830_00175 [bacterium]|nr:hypothetical protein [bacterium]